MRRNKRQTKHFKNNTEMCFILCSHKKKMLIKDGHHSCCNGVIKEIELFVLVTLLLADSYMSPSTLRAYATKFSIRRSFRAAGSGVGNMACTLKKDSRKNTKLNHDISNSILFPHDSISLFLVHLFHCSTYSLCTRWVRRS